MSSLNYLKPRTGVNCKRHLPSSVAPYLSEPKNIGILIISFSRDIYFICVCIHIYIYISIYIVCERKYYVQAIGNWDKSRRGFLNTEHATTKTVSIAKGNMETLTLLLQSSLSCAIQVDALFLCNFVLLRCVDMANSKDHRNIRRWPFLDATPKLLPLEDKATRCEIILKPEMHVSARCSKNDCIGEWTVDGSSFFFLRSSWLQCSLQLAKRFLKSHWNCLKCWVDTSTCHKLRQVLRILFGFRILAPWFMQLKVGFCCAFWTWYVRTHDSQ